jgi:hypothetical protein
MHEFCYNVPTILNFMKCVLLLFLPILLALATIITPSCKKNEPDIPPEVEIEFKVPPYTGSKGPRQFIWSVGIFRGTTPFKFDEFTDTLNPVITASQVTDIKAKFVADPFIYKHNGLYYMFFEIMNATNYRGEIGYATSTDGLKWAYGSIVLREKFHLSYPYVFEHEGQIYMVPESHLDSTVRLYKALDFPTKWALDTILLSGSDFIDPSIVYFNQRWYIFATGVASNYLKLYSSTNLHGPWVEHPKSPVVVNSHHIARPGGRLLEYNGHLYRYAQDVVPYYGIQVFAFKITKISKTEYAEQVVSNTPVVKYGDYFWNRHGMHQVDVFMYADGYYYAVVDGYY